MDALLNLGSGVTINYISNELLHGLEKMKDRRELQRFKRSLEEWALNFEKKHDGTIATNSKFLSYVKNYRLTEIVISYVLFPNAEGLDERAFFTQIRDDMVRGLEGNNSLKLSLEDVEVIHSFLESLLTQTKDFVARGLPNQEQILLYGLCQLQAWDAKLDKFLQKHFCITEEILWQLKEEIRGVHEQLLALGMAQTYFKDEPQLPPEFDQMILSYNDILRKSQEKVEVYSWGTLDFSAVYVPPLLKTNISFRKALQNSTCSRESLLPWFIPPVPDAKTTYDRLSNIYSEADITLFLEKSAIEKRRQRINTIFDFSDIVYVVGGTGYGKSLFLKNLCVNAMELTVFKEKPFLIIQGDLKKMITSDGLFMSMDEYLEKCFIHASLQEPNKLSPQFLERCLKAGRCLILLDALDEVGSDQRNELHQKVIKYFQTVGSGNKVCITSRDRGFIPAKNITCFTISPITEQDVEEYVDRFICLEGFRQENREEFLKQAANSVRTGFLTGFLTLSLLLTIYRSSQDLPSNKVSLYKKCFEYIAYSRERHKQLFLNSATGEKYNWDALDKLMNEATFMNLAQLGTPNNTDIPRNQIDKLMTDLYKTRFHSQMECQLNTEMFLQFCADRTEVFVPSPSSNLEYHFFHRSFYEFFYANYLVTYIDEPKDTYKKIYDFEIDSELFEMLIALYYETNPKKVRPLLEYAFEQAEMQLQEPTSEAGKIFDIMVMLMQMADENDFIERFIKLFLERGRRISTFRLKVQFDQISKVFSKNQEYFKQLYQENHKVYEERIAYEMATYLIQFRNFFSSGLNKNRRIFGKLFPLTNFQYTKLLALIPDRLSVMERIFDNLKAPQYIYGVLKIKGKEGRTASAFASAVQKWPPKERKQIYTVLIFQ